MPFTLRCPGCGRPHEDLDESVLGTDVQCRCGLIFVADDGRGTTSAAPPEVKRKRARKKPAPTEPSASPAVEPQSEPLVETPAIEPQQAFVEPQVVVPQPVVPNVPAPVEQTPPIQSVVPAQQHHQPPSAAPVVTQPGTRPIRPIRSGSRRKKGGLLSSLLIVAVLGAAGVFGVMFALGHIKLGDTPDSPDGTSTAQDSDSAPATQKPRSTGDDGSFDGSVTETDSDNGTGTSTDSHDGNDSDGNGFLIGDGSPHGNQFLTVNPLDESVPFQAELAGQVTDGVRLLLTSRLKLSEKLSELVLSLAAAGDIDALEDVRDLRDQIADGADVSVLDAASHESVIAAKGEYDSQIASAEANLHIAYDAAIESARDDQNAELATALTRERDAGFELPVAAWTVLFRASDPRHWGQSFDGSDGMAIASGQFPERVSSLRLRRMDTQETVVISLGHDDLLQHTHNRGTDLGWRGDDTGTLNSPLHLGLFRSQSPVEPSSSSSDLVTISELPGHPSTGWGFGTTGFGILSQGYVWNGEPIERTEFEIAVSPLQLGQLTPFSLRVEMLDGLDDIKLEPDAPSRDAIVPEIAEALEEHSTAIETARQEVLDAFAEELKSLGAKGDAQGLDAMISARDEFTEGDTVQSIPSTKIRGKLTAFYVDIDDADENLERAYSRTAAVLKRNSEFALSAEVEAELAEGVGYEAKRWFVLLRSIDASVWNTFSRGSQRFARPTSQAPADTVYLRMQLIRKHPSLQNTDPVICQMSTDRLTEATAQGGIGFNGLAAERYGGFHLGMFRMDKSLSIPVDKKYRGFVSLWNNGDDEFLGWGFGHLIKIDRGQGYTWAGQTSPAPLEIEIAVTAKPLRPSETEFLLNGRAAIN